MADPIQQFIQNHMAFQNFMEEQRQFGVQAAMQQRQIENQELNQFAQLAQYVERPEQREALASVFMQRNPEISETIGALAAAMPVDQSVYASRVLGAGMGALSPEQMSGIGTDAVLRMATGQTAGQRAVDQTVAGLPQEALGQAVAIEQGRAMSAPQAENARLGWAGVDLQQQQQVLAERKFQEDVRQFGIEVALRNRAMDQQATQIAQQGYLQELGIMGSAGQIPQMQLSELSKRRRELQGKKDPASQQELRDIEARMSQLTRQIEAEVGALERRNTGQGGGGGMPTLNQLLDARAKAFDDITAAPDRGSQQEALRNYNQLQEFIGSMLGQPQTQLENQRTLRSPFMGNIYQVMPPIGTQPFNPNAGGR